jgi:hypothetical protein
MHPGRGAGVNGLTNYMEFNGIGLVLTRGIFHDDEEELNNAMDLISPDDSETDINQGY